MILGATDTILGYDPITALVAVVIICLLVWLVITLVGVISKRP